MNITKATVAGLLAIGLSGYALAKDDDARNRSGLGGPITDASASSKLAGAIAGTTW